MKKVINYFVLLTVAIICFSCTKDLDTEPEIDKSLSNLLADDPNAVKGILAKLYSGLSVHGQGTPDTDDQKQDILGDDAGETVYLRSLWNLQEMTTDIVKNRWGDNGLDPLTTTQQWSATNKYFGYMYNRIFFQIAQVNNFILELNTIEIAERDVFVAEARFLRALSYYHAMDLFGEVPIVTDADGIGGASKPQASKSAIFTFIEEELLAIETSIPVSSDYGRANRAAVHMVLAKIYLNSEIYIGEKRYDKALIYSEKAIKESSFQLDTNYQSIFQGDNFKSKEIIFPLIADRANTQSFGNTTYLVNGSYSTDTMPIADFGAQNGWTGHRCTQAIYGLFGDLEATKDSRAIFWTEGHEYEMKDYRKWSDGYPTTKFRNSFSDGTTSVTNFSDIDFPMFRLADAYLMYAEAQLQDGGGTKDQALTYINALRKRAFGDASGNINMSELTLDFILDERARELYYEAHRRQDLIRFGKFTGGSYTWPWKGGVATGTSIPATYNLFPKPLEALQANPNLKQNKGY